MAAAPAKLRPRAAQAAPADRTRMKQLTLGVRLRANAVFESFAPGPNAELLAALHGADRDPLWLWGGSGSGKTHLLQAVCAAAGAARGVFSAGPSVRAAAARRSRVSSAAACCASTTSTRSRAISAWEQALFRLFNEAAELRTPR